MVNNTARTQCQREKQMVISKTRFFSHRYISKARHDTDFCLLSCNRNVHRLEVVDMPTAVSNNVSTTTIVPNPVFETKGI
jgi:hypothetical protein